MRDRGENVVAQALGLPLLGHVLGRPEHRDRLVALDDHAPAAGHDSLDAVRPDDAMLEANGRRSATARWIVSIGELAILWVETLEVGGVVDCSSPDGESPKMR